MDLETFISEIPDVSHKKSAELIDYFVYYLTIICSESFATASQVEKCFEETRLSKYSNISSYLTHHSKRRENCKFIKTKNGYQLLRTYQVEMQKTLHSGPAKLETSHLLRGLSSKLTDNYEKEFLQEVVDCYEIGARRASITMMWILTINHLFIYVLKHKSSEFNLILASNTDKRVKVTNVANIDDFSDIPEGKFIEFLRGGKIISNDVRKILDTKLGIRNTSAHPSAVMISDVKATDFIIDLIDNVVAKYSV